VEPAPLNTGWREKIQSPRAARVIPRITDRRSPSLSFAQTGLWFLGQLEPESPAYNRPLALRLSGLLDEAALRQALQTIIDRHEVLRTRFSACDGHPAPVVSPSLPFDLRIIELCHLAPGERESHARRLATEEALRPFDLARDPIFRATLLRLGEGDHILLLIFHHIAFDAWSARILIGEFTNLYRARCSGTSPTLAELPIQYGDFTQWQRQRAGGELLERQGRYWKEQLCGFHPLDLPTDRLRPSVQSHRGGCTEVLLPEALADSLKALGRNENATLFMLLLAALQVLLSRYTGSEDIVVGSMAAGRNWVETERLIGLFLNTLVLRTNLSGNPTFRELLGRVRDTCRGAYSHQDLPFEELLKMLRPERYLSTTPFFQVVFNLENLPEEWAEIPGLQIEEFEFEFPVSPYDLTLEIFPKGRKLKSSFIYNADLFDRGTIERMAGHYRTILEAIVAEPDGRIASLPLLTATERHQILVEWNRTDVEYPRDATIHELFEAQAQRTPEAVALTCEEFSLTYRQLSQRANQVAHALREVGVGPEVIVGIYMERSLDMVIAIMGVLKSGGAYVPLDPAYPAERIAFMLEDTRAPVVLTQSKIAAKLARHRATVICLDSDSPSIAAHSTVNPVSTTTPDNLAYVIYTSGSTSTPNGVMIQHRGLCNLAVAQIRSFGVEPDSRVLQFASISFDASVSEIVMALCRGTTLYLPPPGVALVGEALLQTIAYHGITHVTLAPAVLGNLPEVADLAPIRTLIAAGEALTEEVAKRWRAGRHLINAYGPTEATVCTTVHHCRVGDSGSPPIGRPIANTRVYILDGHGEPAPIGVPGEIYIGGVGVARGYLNQPELTAERFLPDPFAVGAGARMYRTGDLGRWLPDGNIEYLGRNDFQVKIRGFRIELSEVENTLRQHPGVHEAVVTAREDTPGDKRLVAYVVLAGESAGTSGELRDYLKQKLPDYMVPAAWVVLSALPLTPNGKVDRKALPAPDTARPAHSLGFVAPRSETEKKLAGWWAEVLGLDSISIHDNFFELGGHSLTATKLISRIRTGLRIDVPLRGLFERPTVARFSEYIEAIRWTSVESTSSVITLDTNRTEVEL
jgi:amino acid adenylation domain-containing protein